MPLPPEDLLELRFGTRAFEIVMNNLREQGCSCEPTSIKVSRVRGDGTPWTGDNDPGLVEELRKGFLLPTIVDHEDSCALSALLPDPLDRRSSTEAAAALLLESTPALQSGVTVLTKPDVPGEPHLDRQLAGYVEIDDKGDYGQEILSRWNRQEDYQERDNWSRWTLVDRGNRAKIILEIVEADPNTPGNDPNGARGVICFEYPVDRDAILVAGTTGYLLVRAGEAPQEERKELPGTDKIYSSGTATGENSTLITLSTGDQALRMIEIMDNRNPDMTKNRMIDIMRSFDIAQRYEGGIEIGKQSLEDAVEMLKESPRPLAAATSVFTAMAVRMVVLRSERPLTTREVAEAVDLKEGVALHILHEEFQRDDTWVLGHLRSDGQWEWVRNQTITGDTTGITPSHFEGHDLSTADGRMQAARRLLHDMGVEIPIEEVSPAMAFFKSMVDFNRFESAFMELLRKPAPVWASAKGFAKFMQQVQQRAQYAKRLGINNTDQLTYLHLHLGHSMHIAHVLVMDSAQVAVLPEMTDVEQFIFARETPLAFDPLFIDFSGDSQLPEIESSISFEGENVKLIGAMVNCDPDPGVMFITPIFYYGNPEAPTMAIALGTHCINRTPIPNYEFSYVLGATERFTQPAMTLVAASDVLDREPHIAMEYKRIIEVAAERIIGALYLLEAANVQMVPRELSRRDKKRQEKRNWRIPLVVHVERPSRRVHANGNGTGKPIEYSHQFEVIGHYKHYIKGPNVACIVCNGKQAEELVCPRCGGTGLDPDKVKPCTRIDITTGEKTCPHGCRKIWTPKFWKGDPDKPMVVKTRKIR